MKATLKKAVTISIFTIIIVAFGGCSNEKNKDFQQKSSSEVTLPASDFKVTENKEIYKYDNVDVDKLYITILKSNKNSWSDVNNFRFNFSNTRLEEPTVEIRLDLEEPSKDTSRIKPNATAGIRGHAASGAPQKSYKIKLFDNEITWRGQKVLNLNKHPWDLLRIRNKLSYDYLKLIPDSFGVRTQFTQLFVRDLSSDNKEFVDYGMYTHVEQPNKQFLKDHGIAENAYMYKAEMFEFFRYEDQIKNIEEKGYNKSKFEEVLEIKGLEDHNRLIKMLEDVNNNSLNINTIIDKHFDRQNYITWLAYNILIGNYDTNTQNFILISPVTSTKWYFLPWDNDAAWGYDKQPGNEKVLAAWKIEGIANYWGVALHKRFFKDANNLKELSSKIEELSKIMTKEKTEEFLKSYYSATSKYIKSLPDIKYLPSKSEDYESEYKRLPLIVEENKNKFYKDLEIPMPIFLNDVEVKVNGHLFTWEESYDLQGDDLYYDFKVSTTGDFSNVVFSKERLRETGITIPMLKKGKYYWKVDIYDSKGNHQAPFDEAIGENGKVYLGERSFNAE